MSGFVTAITHLLNGGGPWGLYLNSKPAIVAESCVAFEFKQEYRIADYPLETGAFETYDKVWTPFLVHMKLSQGKNSTSRQQFLNALETLAADTNIYDAVTPEKTYKSVNVMGVSYSRKAEGGVSLIVAELLLRQVLVNVTTQTSSTASPLAQDPYSGGAAQALAASSRQISATLASPDLTNPATLGTVPG